MRKNGLSELTITEAAAGLRAQEFSAVELTRVCLDRIGRIDDKLHSFITLTADLALEQAQQAEKELAAGTDRGPLHGIPIALKDLYATRGIRTTCHSAVLRDWIPDDDATVVAIGSCRNRAAGQIGHARIRVRRPIHRCSVSRRAQSMAHRLYSRRLEQRLGSCFGRRALLRLARVRHRRLDPDSLFPLRCRRHQTDLRQCSTGSLHAWVSICGVVGIKPTYGRVSRQGVVPLSWSLDHAGPMARSVEDCALLLQAIAGYDPKDPASPNLPVPDFRATLRQGIRGLRVGVPRENWFNENLGVDAEVLAIFDAALKTLEQLGAVLVEIDGRPFSVARKANQTILVAEAYAYHEQRFQTAPEKFGSAVRRRMLEGAFLSAADYIQAQRARTALNGQIRAYFSRVDAFATPSAPRPPDAFATMDPNEQNLRPSFTNPFNLTGLPAISVPCGFTKTGLPVGLQIAAPTFDEATAFRAAYAYEQATEWHRRRPALPC